MNYITHFILLSNNLDYNFPRGKAVKCIFQYVSTFPFLIESQPLSSSLYVTSALTLHATKRISLFASFIPIVSFLSRYISVIIHLITDIIKYFVRFYRIKCVKGGDYMNEFVYENAFKDRLAILRTQRGVSAREMSLSLGQNAGYINDIESGKTLPSMTLFFYICEYLEITPSVFFDLDVQYPQPIAEINSSLKLLNCEQLNSIAVIVKALAQKSSS